MCNLRDTPSSPVPRLAQLRLSDGVAGSSSDIRPDSLSEYAGGYHLGSDSDSHNERDTADVRCSGTQQRRDTLENTHNEHSHRNGDSRHALRSAGAQRRSHHSSNAAPVAQHPPPPAPTPPLAPDAMCPSLRYPLAFISANLEPPITCATLSELDLARFTKNASLRHDLNFEKCVFRPNYDGEAGERKREAAAEYSTALAWEISCYTVHAISLSSSSARRDSSGMRISTASAAESLALLGQNKRLPRMFAAIKDILKTLVRGEYHGDLDRAFDIDLLEQQLTHGVFDLVHLVRFVGHVLKFSCMNGRQALIENAVSQICGSAMAGDPESLVKGIEQFFSLLETIKLDIANHQIQFLRQLMLADSIAYEQGYFLGRIAQSSIEVLSARRWYDYSMANVSCEASIYETDRSPSPVPSFSSYVSSSSSSTPDPSTPQSPSPPPMLQIEYPPTTVAQVRFAHAVVDLVSSELLDGIPSTFEHDLERFLGLRSDFDNAIYQCAILTAFWKLLKNHLPFDRAMFPDPTPLNNVMTALLLRVWQVEQAQDEDSGYDKSNRDVPSEEAVIEMIRAAYRMVNSENFRFPTDAHIAIVREHIKDSYLYMWTPAAKRLRAKIKSNLLRAVVRETRRIAELSPAAIVELYELQNYNSSGAEAAAIPSTAVTGWIAPGGAATTFVLRKDIGPRLASSGTGGGGDTAGGWDVDDDYYDEEDGGAIAAEAAGSAFLSEDGEPLVGLELLARRIAHVSSLHWRVWAPILYLQPAEIVFGSSDESSGEEYSAVEA